MAQEYSGISLKVILVLENLSEVNFWTSKLILNFPIPYFGPQSPQIAVPQPKIGPPCPYLPVPAHIKWTSMSMSGGPTAYYWNSMSLRTWDPGNTGNNPF